jgi:hypothetical protein
MIKKCLIVLLVLTASVGITEAAILSFSGVYQGKNIFVQNPPVTETEYCTEEVYVNDVKIMSHIASSMYEIDLSHLKMDEPVTIKIIHRDDCKLKILNPQVLRINSTFQFTSFVIDERKLSWSTKGEKVGGKMFVEQFLNNNWVVVKEITCHGSITLNNYQVEESHHSATNKYRVKFLEKDGQAFYSKVVEFNSSKPPVTFSPKRVATSVYLSRTIAYEVIDSYGNVVKKGVGKEIEMTSLKEGVYYLNFDNRTEKVLKK